MGAGRAFRQLKAAALIGDGIVVGDDAPLLDAQDVGKGGGIGDRHEGALGDLRRLGELLVMHRQVDVANVAVGIVDVVDPARGCQKECVSRFL